MKVTPILLVCACLLLAGCGGDTSYTLRPVVDVSEGNDSFTLMNGNYLAYSIEELSTIEFHEVEWRE